MTTRISTPLGPLAVHVHGQGDRTLVLWPSIFTDHHIYDDLATRLSSSARLVMIDGPGHGASPGSGTEFTMAACGQAMLAVMDELGIENAVVGGTSWGGISGAHAALIQPHRVDGLLLMNTPLDLSSQNPSLQSRFIALGSRWMLATTLFRDGVAKSFFSNQTIAAHRAYMGKFHGMLKEANPKHLAAAVRSVLLRGSPLSADLPRISAPTLFVAGREDAMYALRDVQHAAASMPGARLAIVPGKHISSVDAADDVADAILDWLAD